MFDYRLGSQLASRRPSVSFTARISIRWLASYGRPRRYDWMGTLDPQRLCRHDLFPWSIGPSLEISRPQALIAASTPAIGDAECFADFPRTTLTIATRTAIGL